MNSKQQEVIIKIFDDFVKNHSSKDFQLLNSKFIFSHKLWTWNSKISLKKLLVSVGINPDCVISSKRGLYQKTDDFLFNIIDELEGILGRENLNWNSIGKMEKIIPPKSLRTTGTFHLTDKINFPLKKIYPESLVVGLERTFNLKWDEILIKTNREDIKRKVSKYSIEEVYEIYCKNICKYYDCTEQNLLNDPFNIIKQNDLKNDLKQVYKLLWRLPEKVLKRSSDINELLVGIEIITFYGQNKSLEGVDEFINTRVDSSEKLKNISVIKKRKNNHEQNQRDILVGYSKGYFGRGDYFGDKTLYRHINHMEGTSTELYFKKLGIDLENLSDLQTRLSRKYNSREKIWVRIRELVSKSLEENSNCLTREWLEKNDPELIKDSFIVENIKTNSWEKVLKLYGLNPMVWNNSYPLRSYRGFVFEKSIKSVFETHFNEVRKLELLKKGCFIYNKVLSKGLKPDFVFTDFIMDTKFSLTYDKDGIVNQSVSKQLEKYYDFLKLKLVVLTFNQKEKTLLTKQKSYKVELINLKSLSSFFQKNLKIVLSNNNIMTVYENVNSIPFWKTS